MIHVIATISTAAGRRDEVLAAFRELIPLVLAEAGCIEYGTAIDLATPIAVQSPVRDDAVIVVEKWQSVDALQAHLAAPHMLRHRERVKDMVRDVKIQILQPV
jgi:quinol monooxygenase YgiN